MRSCFLMGWDGLLLLGQARKVLAGSSVQHDPVCFLSNALLFVCYAAYCRLPAACCCSVGAVH
jgi:hypothetical protein